MDEQQNNTEMDVQDNKSVSDDVTPKVIKAGSEAKAGRQVLRVGAASNGGNHTDGPDHGATEGARSVMRVGQQALEGAEAATHAAVDVGENTGDGQVLGEWASFARRAYRRNTEAVAELMRCNTLSSLLQWQSTLLSATIVDLAGTNVRILQLVTRKA